jgi:hypothetical protein
MKNYNSHHTKTQTNLNFGGAKKVLKTICCHHYEQQRELDGYQFKLVPVCSECRTARDLQVLANRIERREAR